MNRDPGGREQRLKAGRDRRQTLSRVKLGEVPTGRRRFDPVRVLLDATTGRVPALLPEKYLRMSASSFAFFRGAVAIMAADLGQDPHTGISVQLCGDAHLQNLGS